MADKGGGDNNDASKVGADASTSTATTSTADVVLHRGGCHCGAVTFEFSAPRVLRAVECNCEAFIA